MNIAFIAPGFSNMAGDGTADIYNYFDLISSAELMTEQQKKPQMIAPRVTPLEGVSTHGATMRVRGVENPQGFGIDERRLIAPAQSRLSPEPTKDDEKAIKSTLAPNSKRTQTNFDNVSSYRVCTSSLFNPYFFVSGRKHPRNRTRMTRIARIFTDTFYPCSIVSGKNRYEQY